MLTKPKLMKHIASVSNAGIGAATSIAAIATALGVSGEASYCILWPKSEPVYQYKDNTVSSTVYTGTGEAGKPFEIIYLPDDWSTIFVICAGECGVEFLG